MKVLNDTATIRKVVDGELVVVGMVGCLVSMPDDRSEIDVTFIQEQQLERDSSYRISMEKLGAVISLGSVHDRDPLPLVGFVVDSEPGSELRFKL